MNVVRGSNEIDLVELVRRIIAGDADAETELVDRYQAGVSILINRTMQNRSLAEDAVQETFRILLEKIRHGDVRGPERLSGFIRAVAQNTAIECTRKARRAINHEEVDQAEQLPGPTPDPLEQLLREERARIVRQVIAELNRPRDREVLLRFYIHEEDKARICEDLGLTSLRFNDVISRALKRYRELYLKRFGNL